MWPLMADNSNLTLPISGATKYGDADVASKRRKSPTRPSAEPDDDEYNTVFTKRLIESADLNSTACHDEPDFTGGLVSPNTSHTEDLADPWMPHDLVSQKPSASSRGFENTFKVLESQISGSPHFTPAQVSQVLRGADLRHNPIFLNVPFGARDRFLRAITEERGSVNGDEETNDDEEQLAPSFLELELDARQRIREIELDKSTKRTQCDEVVGESNADAAGQTQCASMTEFLYGIPTHGAPTERFESAVHEEQLPEETGEYPEYVYHMARGKDKRVYLRVVRSLLVDKGKPTRNICFLFNTKD